MAAASYVVGISAQMKKSKKAAAQKKKRGGGRGRRRRPAIVVEAAATKEPTTAGGAFTRAALLGHHHQSTSTTRERLQRMFPEIIADATTTSVSVLPPTISSQLKADVRQPCFVYCLASVGPSPETYIGATVDVRHRLRQHCGEIAGGAERKTLKWTRIWKATPGCADQWFMLRHVTGFPTWRAALQFESAWQRILGRRKKGTDALLNALHTLLARPSASKCGMPFADYARHGGWWPRVEDTPIFLADCRNK